VSEQLSPDEPDESSPAMSKTRKILAGSMLALVVVAAGVYIGGYFMAGDHVPRNASVSGVSIGGVAPERAAEMLRDGLGAKAADDITVEGEESSAALTPPTAGLGIDYAATVRRAGGGKSWNPADIWQVLRGGSDIDPVVKIDEEKLLAAVQALAPTFERDSASATIKLAEGKPVITDSANQIDLDVQTTADRVRDAWLAEDTVKAELTSTAPELTTKDAKEFVAAKVTPLLSGPITLTTEKGKIPITVNDLAAASTISVDGGAFSILTDPLELWSAAQPAIKKLELTGPRNASIKLSGGKPAIVGSKPGEGIDKDAFVKTITPLIDKPSDQRTAKLAINTQQATFSTADAQKMGVKEVIGEFTTGYPHANYRNVNLARAAASMNNSFLKPGETFSLNGTLGERNAANGYVDGWVIVGDHLEEQSGGGISQSATTVFNAIFFAGLEDVEHHPHTMYFDRYPAGREATVYYGSLDLRFRNNTKYGVLLQAYTSQSSPGGRGSITVRVWSTKTWTKVTSTNLSKSNFTTGRTITRSGSQCHEQSASQGFDVNYARLFYRGDTVAKRENFFWRYRPTDRIICE